MGVITRSEASHRLKIISTMVNNAVSASREGNWQESVEAAIEAAKCLDIMIPHLEEAAESDPALAVRTQNSRDGSGGFGYRGGAGNGSGPTITATHSSKKIGSKVQPSSPKPPAPIKLPTPAVAPAPIVVPSAPTPEPRQVTLDISKIAGTPEYDAAVNLRGGGEIYVELTDEEWTMTKEFNALTPDLQDRILKHCRNTGKPVSVRLK
jgi:hypothetical protein